MKYALPLFLLVLIACMKKNPPATSGNLSYTMTHSGLLNGTSFNYTGSSTDTAFLQTHQADNDPSTRYFNLRAWIDGKHLGETVLPGETRIFLDFENYVHYSTDELGPQGTMPQLTAAKLAATYNSPSGYTSVIALVSDGNSTSGVVNYSGVHLQANAVGNALHLYGSVDSISVNGDWLTNLHLDYTFPVNP